MKSHQERMRTLIEFTRLNSTVESYGTLYRYIQRVNPAVCVHLLAAGQILKMLSMLQIFHICLHYGISKVRFVPLI